MAIFPRYFWLDLAPFMDLIGLWHFWLSGLVSIQWFQAVFPCRRGGGGSRRSAAHALRLASVLRLVRGASLRHTLFPSTPPPLTGARSRPLHTTGGTTLLIPKNLEVVKNRFSLGCPKVCISWVLLILMGI